MYNLALKLNLPKWGQNPSVLNFVKHSLDKRAVPLLLELDYAIVYTLVKFEYWRTESKNERVLEKKTWFPVFSWEHKTNFSAWSQVSVKIWPAWRKESGWSSSQRTSNTIATRGGQKKLWQWWLLTMMMMMMMNIMMMTTIMMMMNKMCFLYPKGPQAWSVLLGIDKIYWWWWWYWWITPADSESGPQPFITSYRE